MLICFVFFKQKTAYEMRISDWSSDVCSSDLADIARHADCRALVEAAARAFGGVDIIVHAAADIPHGGLGHVDDERLEAGFASIAKIGRASCRERGWQSV